MKKKTRSKVVSSGNFFGPLPILAGEDEAAYEELMGRVYAAVKPVDVIDEMLIQEVVASEWEFLRWSRWKFSLFQACADQGLQRFLTDYLDFNWYREDFEEKLTKVLQDNFPEYQAEELEKLVNGCARKQTSAVDQVEKLLGGIGNPEDVFRGRINLDYVHGGARFKRAKKLVKDYLGRETRVVMLVDDLLAKAGETIDGLMLSHLKEQLENIERFDRLISIAEGRRNASLREVDRRRSALGEMLRRSVQEIEDDELKMIETTAGNGKDAA